MAKYLVQIIVLGTQAVGKAFAKAVRQEYQVSVELKMSLKRRSYITFK